jgi:1-acyl-sn-glycerol-3-phosphate acyltransferase
VGNLKHRIIWRLLRFPASVFLKLKYNYSCGQAGRIPGPFLLIANHVTDLDPLMVGCSFKQQMYFVASEHLFRKGFLTKLLVWLAAPIPRIKGSTDTVSAMNILRALKRKSNVGLFAEGDKSWDGTTLPLHPTTARLIKAAKATLVTYRISGGYLSSPRWGATVRRGRMHGRVVGVYTPEQLRGMTDEALTGMISRDIEEDAYQAQRLNPVAYRGKNLAEHLEMALYTCPSCCGIATMHSRGDTFYCECGLSVTYNEYGFFQGESLPFETITQWDKWQDAFLAAHVKSTGDGPIVQDPGQSLYRINADHSETLVAQGTMRLYRDRFELGDFSVPLEKLYQMGVYGAGTIVFSAEGVNYEIKSAVLRSGRKYLTLYQLLTGSLVSARANAATL